jgi:hypothetical protein
VTVWAAVKCLKRRMTRGPVFYGIVPILEFTSLFPDKFNTGRITVPYVSINIYFYGVYFPACGSFTFSC